ncbi:MAG: acyl carrier protein [Candidatus Riflebacteria bacterium]|nr:acyl carrier protein [Candidatus Riflebacteria bacterium]
MKRPSVSRDELVAMVVDTFFSVAKIHVSEDRFDENLFHLGLDSLKAIQVINSIEERLDVMIDDSHLRKLTSIRAIADFFEALPVA